MSVVYRMEDYVNHRNCPDCGKNFRVKMTSRQKYCNECLKIRRAKGPKKRKGQPVLVFTPPTGWPYWKEKTPFKK